MFNILEDSVVVKAMIDVEDIRDVDNVNSCSRLEGDRSVDVAGGAVLPLELFCVTDVVAKLKNEESPRALEDVTVWTELISVVNKIPDNIGEEDGWELILLDSAGLLKTVIDENVEKSCNVTLVKEKDIVREN